MPSIDSLDAPDGILHKAGWVVSDPWTILRDGWVFVKDQQIIELGKGRANIKNARFVDHGQGALIPALVNAHTHIDFSALHKKMRPFLGFLEWVKSLMTAMGDVSVEQILAGTKNGVDELLITGCRTVGDISGLGVSRQVFMNSCLAGVWFREFLGDPETIHLNVINGESPEKVVSLAGHGPHTTSPECLAGLKQITKVNGAPFSIHLAESAEEHQFIHNGNGEWADFLTERQIDYSGWPIPARSPVAYLDLLGVLDDKTLAVHLLTADKKDFERLSDKQVKVCVCPRSNQFIHDCLPDIVTMLNHGIKPCLGTDSLASNDSLNMFDEMQFVAIAYPSIPLEEILAMATVNGARALGMEAVTGSIKPGHRPHMIYVPVSASSAEDALEQIISCNVNQLRAV